MAPEGFPWCRNVQFTPFRVLSSKASLCVNLRIMAPDLRAAGKQHCSISIRRTSKGGFVLSPPHLVPNLPHAQTALTFYRLAESPSPASETHPLGSRTTNYRHLCSEASYCQKGLGYFPPDSSHTSTAAP